MHPLTETLKDCRETKESLPWKERDKVVRSWLKEVADKLIKACGFKDKYSTNYVMIDTVNTILGLESEARLDKADIENLSYGETIAHLVRRIESLENVIRSQGISL